MAARRKVRGRPKPLRRGGAPAVAAAPAAPRPAGASTLALDKLIDDVRKRTGHDKVNLVGHSAGTAQSATYLSDPTRAAKIAHYASVGGTAASNPNGVPSIAVSGVGDNGRGPSASNGGKVAWMPDYQDHVMVCTSDESFWGIYTFFNDGEKPKTMKITPEAEPQVGGYVKSHVINKPLAGDTVEVWEVAKATGKRLKDKPLTTLTVAEDGQWGPFRAKPGQNYEFVVNDKVSPRPIHFYREPFDHTDRLIYFRIGGEGEGYQPSPFSRVPKLLNDKTSAFIVFHENGSFLPQNMSLKVNGTELIVDSVLPVSPRPNQTPTVALYLADGNENGKTDLTRIEGISAGFSTSADVFVPADPNKHVEFKLNDRVINVPAMKGSEAGPIVVVFNDYR